MKTLSRSRLLTAADLSLVLDISETTARKMAKTKQIPCRIINRRPYFSFPAVLRYFRSLEGGGKC